MTDITEYYADQYEITDEMAAKRALIKGNANAIRTAKKEMIGEEIIKAFGLFGRIWPNSTFIKVRTVANQLKGIDFIVTEQNGKVHNVDIKVCIGPDYLNTIPIEIKQNGKVTFTDDKATTDILFVIADSYGKRYALLDYEEVKNIVANHKDYKLNTSNNGSGLYIKYNIEQKVLWPYLY